MNQWITLCLVFVSSMPSLAAKPTKKVPLDLISESRDALTDELKKTSLSVGTLTNDEEAFIQKAASNLSFYVSYGNAGGNMRATSDILLEVDTEDLSTSKALLEAMSILFVEESAGDSKDETGHLSTRVRLDQYVAEKTALRTVMSVTYYNKELRDGGEEFLKNGKEKEIHAELTRLFLRKAAYLGLVQGIKFSLENGQAKR